MNTYLVMFDNGDELPERVFADYFDIDEKDGSLTFYKFNNNVEEDIVFFCCWCKVKFVKKVDK